MCLSTALSAPPSCHTPCCAMIPGLSLAVCLLYSMSFNPVHVSALLWICVSCSLLLYTPHMPFVGASLLPQEMCILLDLKIYIVSCASIT